MIELAIVVVASILGGALITSVIFYIGDAVANRAAREKGKK